MNIDLSLSEKQELFVDADADEILYGGAAGGGKSYGQLIDALLYALTYKKSKQLILRRTFPDLEKSLIRVALEIFPRALYRYNASSHSMSFFNGSIIDFGYLANDRDVYQYQSAEYDVIRFDELTHFTEYQYTYMFSRVRGANPYPKRIKSSTNPGGVGHEWVKERFIDIGPWNTVHKSDTGTTRLFIPALATDNPALMANDPEYMRRLDNLSGDELKALKYGDWDLSGDQYFTEFKRDIHVISPFEIPSYWRRYVTLDYGLDMLACYWIAVDNNARAYVYDEIYQSGLIVSDAAQLIAQRTKEQNLTEGIYAHYAPPDLWNRNNQTGESTAELFQKNGILLWRADNDRVQGWLALKEWLKPYSDENGNTISNLRIFDCCKNLIRTLPALQRDMHKPNDTANEPHELTHAPDAIRYFIAGRPAPFRPEAPPPQYNFKSEKPKPKFHGYGDKIKPL